MKILHTSDWHLGRSLYDRKRYDEFEAFLNWLIEFIVNEKIDALLVAGDVFDSSTPSNRAQELYYRFLARISATGCQHVIVIGGNHDSPSFLEAPKNLLRALNIHVVGAISGNPEDEVFVLKDNKGVAEAVVCAVPYLRDRDIRTVEAGETIDDKTDKLLQGITGHYGAIAALGIEHGKRHKNLPVIGMGHLFTREGKTAEGDGVRELYIGSLVHIDGQSISAGFDYMALGHLHQAQTVGGSETIRYSGSPVPMSFTEAGQNKKVIIADFNGQAPVITEQDIPCFQKLERISGDMEAVSNRIKELKKDESNAWLEIEITSQVMPTIVTAALDELITGSALEILRIRNKSIIEHTLTMHAEGETLDELTDVEVFNRCLDAHEIAEPNRTLLLNTYREVIATLADEDPNSK